MLEPAAMPRLIPVILAGGTGTRLWPASTADCPKQFLALDGRDSLFVQTLRRFPPDADVAPPIVAGNIRHVRLIAGQCAASGIEPQTLILEPATLNTAVAIALAALTAEPDACLLVMPSDHLMSGIAPFRKAALAHRALLGGEDLIATFGLLPQRPETGYGYIKPGIPIAAAARLEAFHEKPDAATARHLIGLGWLWNSGIFMGRAAVLVAVMERLAPTIIAAARQAFAMGQRDGTTYLPAAEPLQELPPLSFDRAVMERGAPGIVIPLDVGWSDVGAWDEVWRTAARDPHGNAATGNVILHNARDSYVSSDGGLTVLCGVAGIAVINCCGKVLVTSMSDAQSVRNIVDTRPAQDSCEPA